MIKKLRRWRHAGRVPRSSTQPPRHTNARPDFLRRTGRRRAVETAKTSVTDRLILIRIRIQLLKNQLKKNLSKTYFSKMIIFLKFPQKFCGWIFPNRIHFLKRIRVAGLKRFRIRNTGLSCWTSINGRNFRNVSCING